jgi:hypothetical protein
MNTKRFARSLSTGEIEDNGGSWHDKAGVKPVLSLFSKELFIPAETPGWNTHS